ncbi:helix-turn-helix domain-containing protein [Bifidobacterium amazonense]|uniref:Helix-turn-helix domain-containing protein n=1 Tax=Bifidobacterium amazonense TaxID=2809027 RepID=A0ABS9VV49_9BIFI|nr:helix-turn-helix domain-containing protein [Bifidobacterium amazonense]MCH9275816.1 helix-turn-helix domain-containing protein [Bifidobacterium amazonense]
MSDKTIPNVPVADKLMWTAREVVAMTGIPLQRVYAEVKAGNLQPRYCGSQTARFRRQDVLDWTNALPTDWA